MENQALDKLYASLDVLRKIGVKPTEEQLIRLSVFEEKLLQQASIAFINNVKTIRRPFMLQLDYEPGKKPVQTIVIDDKSLPICLPEDKIEQNAPDKLQSIRPIEPVKRPQITAVAVPISDHGQSDSSIKAAEQQPQVTTTKEPDYTLSLFENLRPIASKDEDEPNPTDNPKSNTDDDFFLSLYDKTAEDSKPKRTRQKYSLNGSHFMKKEELVFEIIKLYLRHHPRSTFAELQQVFSDDYCTNKFKSIGFLVSEDELDNWYYSGKYNIYHGDDPNSRFVSADGIGFYHYAQWTHDALLPIIELAESFGYRITTDKD